jgi:hypothetical protein
MKNIYKIMGISLIALMTSCYSPKKLSKSQGEKYEIWKSTNRSKVLQYGPHRDTMQLNDAIDIFKGQKHIFSSEIGEGVDNILIYKKNVEKKHIERNIGNDINNINYRKVIRLYNRHK